MRYLILFALLAAVLAAPAVGQTYTQVAADARSHNFHPSVSDDGNRIMWIKEAGRSGWANLYVTDLWTQSIQQLTTIGRIGSPGNAAVSGDGRLVAYIANANIWMVPATGGTPKKVTNFTTQVPVRDVVLSRDGFKVGFTLWNGPTGTYDFAVLDTQTKSVRIVTNATVKNDPLHGTMSADGSMVAFVAKRGNANHHLWFVGSDGGNLRKASSVKAAPACPSLDRSASRCAFLVARPNSKSDVATIRTDGTQLVNVSKTAEWDASPKLSADGERIVWVTRLPGVNIDSVRTAYSDGSALRTLAKGAFSGLAVNGDGSTVVFAIGIPYFPVPYDLTAWKDRLTRAAGSVPNPGNTVPLILQDKNLAGGSYLVRSALSRTPGINLPGVGTVPLTADALFTFSGQAPSIFQNYSGVLDAKGLAGPSIHLPNLPALKGLSFYTAAVGVKGSATTIFNSIRITIE